MGLQQLLQVNTVVIIFLVWSITAGTSLIYFRLEVTGYGIVPVEGIDYFNMFIQQLLMKKNNAQKGPGNLLQIISNSEQTIIMTKKLCLL